MDYWESISADIASIKKEKKSFVQGRCCTEWILAEQYDNSTARYTAGAVGYTKAINTNAFHGVCTFRTQFN